jgi:ribonuclease HI
MKKHNIYADGSSLNNGKPNARGGWAYVMETPADKCRVEQAGNLRGATNNQMELTAVIEGFKCIKEPSLVEVVTDSNYVVKGASEWIKGWVKKDFKDVKNVELWKELIRVTAGHRIKWTWVKGHAGHPMNEKCDKMAVAAASKL